MRLGDIDAVRDKLLHDSFLSWHDFNTVMHALDEAPTVDAVQVVRCKDCCHGMILYSDNDPIDGYCRLHNIAVTKDFFCADGERRDSENG